MSNQNNILDRLQKIKQRNNETKSLFEQNKIHINNDDSYADKTFFAFLADILNSFKSKKIEDNGYDELFKELQENENLTKQKLNKLLNDELHNNNFLSNEQKSNIQNFLNKENDFACNLIGDKIKEVNDCVKDCKGMDKVSLKSKLDSIKITADNIRNVSLIVKDAFTNVIKNKLV